jgi:hypothetical protein
MKWLLIIAAGIPGIFGEGILGTSINNVILINATGLKIIRVIIADRTYEDIATKADKILISVTPKKHHLELVFRGGSRIDWYNFDFHDIHQITFDLVGNKVSAHPK